MWPNLLRRQRMAVVAVAVLAALIGAVFVLRALYADPVLKGRKVSEKELLQRFQAKTGLRLYRRAFDSTDGVDAFVLADETVAQEARYGAFAVYLVSKGLYSGATTLLGGGAPDADGVVWSREEGQGLGIDGALREAVARQGGPQLHGAVATTEYGANVFLVWHADEVGRTDARWKRLDRVLRSVAERVICRDCILDRRDLEAAEQPYRKTLETSRERKTYDEAWTICDPSIDVYFRPKGQSATEARAAFIAFVAGVYGGGSTDSEHIAAGVANTLARITSAHEQPARAREIWRRACLDGLVHER